jgi:sulfatase modifying factor 1
MGSPNLPLWIRFGLLVGVSGAVFASVSATGIVKKDGPKAEVGSCAAYSGLPSGDGETAGMIFVPAGTFAMGSDQHQPEERFTHFTRVDGFWIDRHEVTNAQFKKFVEATGYVTLVLMH